MKRSKTTTPTYADIPDGTRFVWAAAPNDEPHTKVAIGTSRNDAGRMFAVCQPSLPVVVLPPQESA